jgi:hypothetical protein
LVRSQKSFGTGIATDVTPRIASATFTGVLDANPKATSGEIKLPKNRTPSHAIDG